MGYCHYWDLNDKGNEENYQKAREDIFKIVEENCYSSAYYGTTLIVSSYGIYWTAHGDDGCHCETEEVGWNTLETIRAILNNDTRTFKEIEEDK